MQCFRLESFFDYLFCLICFPKAAAEYASFQDVQRREAWRRSLETQIVNLRSRVIEAIGVSSTIGVAVGGAVVAVAGVAAGLAHGVVRGAATGSNVPQLALPLTNDEQASDAFLSLDGSSKSRSVRAGGLLEGSGEERARAPAMGRRPPRCQACWNPQIGFLRPLQHLYYGDCKLTLPSLTAAASAAAEAATTAAMAISLPQSQGSLFGSVMSDAEVPPLIKVQEEHRPAAGQAGDVGPAGRETVWQRGAPSDRPCREGNFSNAPQPRLPPPLQPVLPPQTGMTPEDRLAVLEGMMMDVGSDLQAMRNDMRNILRDANAAGEESQRVALRMDNLEFEWLVWNEGQQLDATSPEQQHAEENQHLVTPTPASTPRAFEDVHTDLLGLDSDLLQQWWDAAAPHGATYLSSEPLPMGLPVSFAPEGGEEQFSAERNALRSAPPGIELTMATAVGNLERRRPEGLIQAMHLSNVRDGQRGDAYLVPVKIGIDAARCHVYFADEHAGRQSRRCSWSSRAEKQRHL